MEDSGVYHPPSTEEAAASAAPVVQQINSRLHHIVFDLPIDHITSYLSNTSVAFFALAISKSYSPTSPFNGHTFGAENSDEAVRLLMARAAGRWDDIKLESVEWINDGDVNLLLSLVNQFDRNALRSLTIRDCPNVDGSGLSSIRYSNAVSYVCFYDNKRLTRRSPRLMQGPLPLDVVRSTFYDIIWGDGRCMRYLRVPMEWTVLQTRLLDYMNCPGLDIIGSCINGHESFIYHWCQFCGAGPFCSSCQCPYTAENSRAYFCWNASNVMCCAACLRDGGRCSCLGSRCFDLRWHQLSEWEQDWNENWNDDTSWARADSLLMG